MNKLLIAASLSLALVACESEKPAENTANDKTAEKAPDKTEKKGDEAKPEKKKDDPHAAFTNLDPEAVDKLVADKGCVPVDANGKNTRDKYGILPGAVLLSGMDYEANELPEDKKTKLVFYCGGEKCTAAPKAAKLAKEAGYEDVNVMRAGIRGWVDAGKKVDKPAT